MSILDKVMTFFDKAKASLAKPEDKSESDNKESTTSSKPSNTTKTSKQENTKMAKITKTMVGESLNGDGNEVAHIDLLIGPRGSAVESAFTHALTNNKDGFSSLLAVVAPNLITKPATVMFNKVTIKGSKQAVQMFGPAQRGVAMAVADSVEDGTIPADEADDVFICVGVFIHWLAEDDAAIQKNNYDATKESIKRAVAGSPTAAEVVKAKATATHPFAAN